MTKGSSRRFVKNSMGYPATVITAILLALLASPVFAATSSVGLDFDAPTGSLWGAGPSAILQFEESASVGPISFGYDFGASTGTVSAAINGSLNADHPDALAAPGNASINLSFLGNAGGGLLETDLGVWANITAAGFDILDKSYSLNIDQTFLPHIGAPGAAGSDAFAVNVPAIDVVIAEAGAGFQVAQASTLEINGVSGTLSYARQGSGETFSTPFSLSSDGMLSEIVSLDSAGTWDFWASDLTLANTFSSDFDLGIFLYESHPWIRWGSIWGIPYPIPTTDTNMIEFADLDLFGIDPFSLAFNEIDFTNPMFSIQVGEGDPTSVPEPGTMALLGSGLAALASFGRRRAAH